MVDAVAGKAHEQVAGLEVAGFHLQQGFLGRWAELTAEAKLLAHLRQERNRALRRKVVEAQGRQAVAAPAAIGGEQMELAAQAVAQPEAGAASRVGKLAAQAAELAPGRIGLALVVKAGHVAPGGDLPTPQGQGLQEAPIAQLGFGGQVTAPNELN